MVIVSIQINQHMHTRTHLRARAELHFSPNYRGQVVGVVKEKDKGREGGKGGRREVREEVLEG